MGIRKRDYPAFINAGIENGLLVESRGRYLNNMPHIPENEKNKLDYIDAFKFNPDDIKYTDQSFIIDVGNRFMENAPFSFEATTIVDIIFVFAGIAVLFLGFIYLVFEIYLFINFMSSRNKPTIK